MPTTHVIADLVRQQTTTTGTGTLSLGTVPAGCRGVVAGIGNGKKARYKLAASDGGWEIGLGTATAGSPDTFSRDTVYASSAGGTTKITLPAGTHTLDVTLDAKSANEMTPRLLGIGNGVTLSSGTLTVDCQGSCDVLAVVALTGNVTTVVMSNLPERATIEMWVTHSGGPWTFPQNAWPAGTTLHGSYNLYTDTTVTRFWWTTADSGTTAILECNGPAAGATGDAYATSHEADTTAHLASSIVNTPAGNIAATTVQAALNELDSEKSATSHTHSGVYEPVDAALLRQADVDDTPVNGVTTAPVSSNWAYDHAALTTAHGITAAAATVLDDSTVADMVNTLGGASSSGTGGLVRAINPTLAAATLSGTLDGGGQEIGRCLNRVVTSVTGALTVATHSGCVLKTSGNVTVPTTAGFNAVIIAGGAHTVTFNGTTSAALASGDIMTVVVESATVIHAVKTASADKVTFA